MTVQSAYNQWASTYDTDDNLTRDLDAQVTKSALENVHCRAMLELGCGTGKNTLFLAQLADSVVALDFSPKMLAQAETKVTAAHVQFARADLTQKWPISDHSVDYIVCNLVLEHIEDLRFIFSEASRTLTEGGRFFISELHPFKQYLGGKANFSQGSRAIEIPAFIHHVSDFLAAALENELRLIDLGEWWHEHDQNQPPRLVTFLFEV
ncbi:MAG: class I SAM-dependent methyltransferase [Anaerolineae bacterium]|nr:class I SAM-dependent methyltransferase [Anaerolineae bacterium]